MAKPEVVVTALAPLVAGGEAVFAVDVTAAAETKIDFVDAWLVAEQGWVTGAGKSRISKREVTPSPVQRLASALTLAAASTTRLSTRFALGALPPSHAERPAYAQLALAIHVSIPWRLDGRYRHGLHVRLPAPGVVTRTPIAVRSTSSSAPPDAPRLELGLGSTRLVAGEVLIGTCAVYHLDDRKPREVELALVPELTLLGRGRPRERDGAAIRAVVVVPAGGAGTNVPFRLALPATMTPSFTARTHALRWRLVARAGSFFGGHVEVAVPLEIVDASAAATTPRLVAAPELADQRTALLFARFARGGWRVAEVDVDGDPPVDQQAVVRDGDGGELRIGYAYRGVDGAFLVARVHHPSLGLGLHVTPSSSLREVFFRDVEVDIEPWDRAHHVVARAAAQAVPFLRAVVPALMRCGRLGALVRWSDDELVFEQRVSNPDDAQLAALATDLAMVASAVALARPAIAVPPDVVVDRAAWEALARWLRGPLSPGDLSIEGALDGAPVELGLVWTGARPTAVHVALGAPEAASAELRAVAIALARPNVDVLRPGAAEPLVELLTAWPADLIELRVVDGVASASYALPAGDRPAVDAARVRELVEALRAVLGALAQGPGPYR
jgi:hypothetical protein